jgi:flagellar basal body-associated protein FliL
MSSTRDNLTEPELNFTSQKRDVEETTPNDGKSPVTETDAEGDGGAAVAPSEQRGKWSKRWLLVGVAGVLALSAGVAAHFLIISQETPPQTVTSKISAKLPEAAETLPDFLVPLEADSEHVVLRVSLALHWSPEVRARFMQRQIAIRSEIYHRLGAIIASGLITGKEDAPEYKYKAELEGEITRIFERELGAQQLMVSVLEVDLL